MKVKYCTICRKEPKKFFRIPVYKFKKYYICSEECYKKYIEQIWREDSPQETKEYPDY